MEHGCLVTWALPLHSSGQVTCRPPSCSNVWMGVRGVGMGSVHMASILGPEYEILLSRAALAWILTLRSPVLLVEG